MNNINIALVGCGGFGNFHLDNLLNIPDVNVIAAVSSSPHNLERVMKKVPAIHGYSTHEEMFDKEPTLDAVIICVPPACHKGVEICAAKHGVHVFVEKPVGLDLAEAELTLAEIEKAGIISFVGYQGRYNKHIEEIRDYISNHKIGMATARFIGSRPGVAWWSDDSLSGGQIVEQATHMFDILRYLFGEVREVYTQKSQRSDYTAECSITTLSFVNGLVATVATGCYLEHKACGDVGFTLYTDDSRIEYNWDSSVSFINREKTITKHFDESSHIISLNTFIRAVKSNDRTIIRSDYKDALETLKLTLLAASQISNR